MNIYLDNDTDISKIDIKTKIIFVLLHGYPYLRCETDGMKISSRNVATLENRQEKAGPEGII